MMMTPDYARRADKLGTADDLEATARRLRTIARTVATELLRARESILCGSDGTIDPDEWAAEGEPVCDMGEGAAWEVMTVADDCVSAYAAVLEARAADMRRAADEPRPGSYDDNPY